ncbi:MAG: crossover junction endodeoxyribonuclease RuvC [Pseudomonadales bacterium]|nr:crossover junction endodeoxyribonuclease RuvC [Pseudomonadales bacterium]
MALILGIDPGSRLTGYGIINALGNRFEYVCSGCLRLQNETHQLRLKQIFEGITQIIVEYSPQQAAIEEVFLGKSVASALKLGQARGSAMVACLQQDLPLSEYSARKVKQTVTGSGSAAKTQVQHMVKILLGLSGKLQEDASDALAIAICHANTQAGLLRISDAASFSRSRLQQRP